MLYMDRLLLKSSGYPFAEVSNHPFLYKTGSYSYINHSLCIIVIMIMISTLLSASWSWSTLSSTLSTSSSVNCNVTNILWWLHSVLINIWYRSDEKSWCLRAKYLWVQVNSLWVNSQVFENAHASFNLSSCPCELITCTIVLYSWCTVAFSTWVFVLEYLSPSTRTCASP